MTTPARRQYLRIKKEHQDEVLLFRMGDFYETFDEDARIIARELEIALTSREMGKGQRVPLAGIPYHALEPYLARADQEGLPGGHLRADERPGPRPAASWTARSSAL